MKKENIICSLYTPIGFIVGIISIIGILGICSWSLSRKKEEIPKIINNYQKLMPEGYIMESDGKNFRYKRGLGLLPYDYSSTHEIEEGVISDAWRDVFYKKLRDLNKNSNWEKVK